MNPVKDSTTSQNKSFEIPSKTQVEKKAFDAVSSTQAKRDPDYAFKASAYLASLAGLSALFGFGATLAVAKKRDPQYFDKGLGMSPSLSESGAALALRALGWGTAYAVGGCSILFFTLWKLSGCNNLHEFRIKMGEKLPKIRKNDPPQSRTEFEGLSDLMMYLESWGKEKSESKASGSDLSKTISSSNVSARRTD